MAEYTFHICDKGQHTHFIIGHSVEPMATGETMVVLDDKKTVVGVVRLAEGMSIVRAE